MGPGDVIADRYEILRTIGSGGMGDVYQARRRPDGIFFAIKVLRVDLVQDHEAVTRFHREARAAAALKSDYAARIFDVGELPTRQPYIVMEYLQGVDLMSEIDTRHRIPIVEAIGWVLQACHAMAEAHDLGIVHRDLKPPNIFLAQRGPQRIAKVLDFGISKVSRLQDGHVTSTQMSFGSPLYMSPEQIRSTKFVDSRADIWSLGVILYEAITGQPPFTAETSGALAVVISVEPHIPAHELCPEVSPELSMAIDRALQKRPQDRYATVREFSQALEAVLAKLRGRPPGGSARSGFGTPSSPGEAPPGSPSNRGYRGELPSGADARFGASVPPPGAGQVPTAYATTTLSGRTTRRTANERLGILIAAVLIPLGAIAFAFAVFLYRRRAQEVPKLPTPTTTESKNSGPGASPVVPDVTPSATLVASSPSNVAPSSSASSKPSASASSAKTAGSRPSASATATASAKAPKTGSRHVPNAP